MGKNHRRERRIERRTDRVECEEMPSIYQTGLKLHVSVQGCSQMFHVGF